LTVSTIAESDYRVRYSVHEMAISVSQRVPKELLQSTGFLLKRLGFDIKEKNYAAFEPTGFSPLHYAVLSLLDEGARRTQGEIADALGYDRSQLVGILDDLQDRGLVERERDREDRRRHSVRLTPPGKECLAELRTISKGVENEFFSPLDATERGILHELLAKLAAAHDPRCSSVSSSASRSA
jgi:MarR family transcriptional regulator, lower aerobic nicotinate degradation pathway regulator